MFINADNYPYKQWKVVRILLGLYFSFHWIFIFYVRDELYVKNFSNYSYLPRFVQSVHDILFLSSDVTNLIISMAVLFSLLFALGVSQRVFATILIVLYFFFFLRSQMSTHLHYGFLNWLMLAYAFGPGAGDSRSWKMPDWLLSSAWLVIGICYSVSGLYKIFFVFWQDGSAIGRMINLNGFPHSLNGFLAHSPISRIMTWYTLFAELFFLPSIFFKPTRFIFLILMTFVHVGIATLTVLWPLSIGILIFHLFLFDVNYIKSTLKRFKFSYI